MNEHPIHTGCPVIVDPLSFGTDKYFQTNITCKYYKQSQSTF